MNDSRVSIMNIIHSFTKYECFFVKNNTLLKNYWEEDNKCMK